MAEQDSDETEDDPGRPLPLVAELAATGAWPLTHGDPGTAPVTRDEPRSGPAAMTTAVGEGRFALEDRVGAGGWGPSTAPWIG
jgi:hypothetical protein